jgi:hypothetical protein
MTEPKQLTEDERTALLRAWRHQRAVELIDALTATMAEQAAQIFLDGRRIKELEGEVEQAKDAWGQAALMTRAESAEQKLAAANVLLADCARGNRAIWPYEARAHLAGQPAPDVPTIVTTEAVISAARRAVIRSHGPIVTDSEVGRVYRLATVLRAMLDVMPNEQRKEVLDNITTTYGV